MIPLPDLAVWARWAMRFAIGFAVGWMLIAYGGARQGTVNVTVIDNATRCVALTHRALDLAERSAALHASRSGALEAFLRGGERGEVVVAADSVRVVEGS